MCWARRGDRSLWALGYEDIADRSRIAARPKCRPWSALSCAHLVLMIVDHGFLMALIVRVPRGTT